jgi:hypothetical protein
MTQPAYSPSRYELAWPKITRTLERLCDKYGFETVLGIFSNDMPDHRREREQEERERQAQKKHARATRKQRKSGEVISLAAYRKA